MRLYSMNKDVQRRQSMEHFKDIERDKERDRQYSRKRLAMIMQDPEANERRLQYMRDYKKKKKQPLQQEHNEI